MPHPDIDNRTPFAVELMFLTDEEGRPLVVPLLQASFGIAPDGSLSLLQPQPPLPIAGEWWGDPASSSLKFEPAIAFMKPAVDVALIGHALAPPGGAAELQVGLRVGSLMRTARVYGDRMLVGRSRITRPARFERVALRWENAFGGWDRRDPDPARHRCEPRNPVGRGFRDASRGPDEDLPMPNIEDASVAFDEFGARPPPAGFGFIAPHWQPRAGYAGTHDEAWTRQRMPLLPLDFDRRFFCAAATGMTLESPLRGDETVVLANVTPGGRLSFALPGLSTPACELAIRRADRRSLPMLLDTVIIDADESVLRLTYRAASPLPGGPHDLLAAQFTVPGELARWQRHFVGAYRADRGAG